MVAATNPAMKAMTYAVLAYKGQFEQEVVCTWPVSSHAELHAGSMLHGWPGSMGCPLQGSLTAAASTMRQSSQPCMHTLRV